jgi:hypothetical protein
VLSRRRTLDLFARVCKYFVEVALLQLGHYPCSFL